MLKLKTIYLQYYYLKYSYRNSIMLYTYAFRNNNEHNLSLLVSMAVSR